MTDGGSGPERMPFAETLGIDVTETELRRLDRSLVARVTQSQLVRSPAR